MDSEERIARLERVSKPFPRAGRRELRRVRTLEGKVTTEEKIDIIIDFQIATEGRFARNEERFAELMEAQAQTERRFAEMADAQSQTQRRLDAFIEAIQRDRNGH